MSNVNKEEIIRETNTLSSLSPKDISDSKESRKLMSYIIKKMNSIKF